MPPDPALAEVMLDWKRKTEFHSKSDFVFASPFAAGEKPFTPWNMQHRSVKKNHHQEALDVRSSWRYTTLLHYQLFDSHSEIATPL